MREAWSWVHENDRLCSTYMHILYLYVKYFTHFLGIIYIYVSKYEVDIHFFSVEKKLKMNQMDRWSFLSVSNAKWIFKSISYRKHFLILKQNLLKYYLYTKILIVLFQLLIPRTPTKSNSFEIDVTSKTKIYDNLLSYYRICVRG